MKVPGFLFPTPPAFARSRLPEPGGPLTQGGFTSPLHDQRVAAKLGAALGVAFFTCFFTGVISHLHQQPVSWIPIPSRPAGLFRLTQGIHITTGMASIPLLFAKLWTVFPRFVQWPPFKTVGQGVERLLLLPLVAGALFLLFTGTANVASWYPWRFDFRRTHGWVGVITIGALLAHIGATIVISRAAWARQRPTLAMADPRTGDLAEPAPGAVGAGGLTRRGFLMSAAAASGAVIVATVGSTFRPFRAISVLGARDPKIGPQGLPVNRTARSAGTEAIDPDAYRLDVVGKVRRPLSLSLAELQALPKHTATLPISCVEGWSASATWSGVVVRDLVAMAGGAKGRRVRIDSLEKSGAYASSILETAHAGDRDTLLATHVNGEELHPEHGWPLRLMAPNRPGVLQTKWVTRIEVL